MSGPDFEAAASRLRAYLAEPRPPLTIDDLARALGCSALAAGWAILHLREQGRLSAEILPGRRFRLRSTEDGASTDPHPDDNAGAPRPPDPIR